MDDHVPDYVLRRVYFVVSSKDGEATLDVEHPAARQSLTLPVHPSSAVEEALPLLFAPAAHYAAQWHKIMVGNPEDRDACGFSAPAAHLPDGIAHPDAADSLKHAALQHAGPEGTAWLEQGAHAFNTAFEPALGNLDEIALELEFFGEIDPWTANDSSSP